MPLMQSPVVPAGNLANSAVAFGGVAAALASGDADVRRATARYVDPVTNSTMLVAHIGFELDTGVRDIIIDRLAGSRDLEAARPLLGMVRSDDVALRNTVIASLPQVGETLLPELRPLLENADASVRIAAVNVLQGLRSQLAVDLAIDRVNHDPHVNVCSAAIDVIAEAGDASAIEPLRALVLRFPDVPFIAFAVDAAIKRIG